MSLKIIAVLMTVLDVVPEARKFAGTLTWTGKFNVNPAGTTGPKSHSTTPTPPPHGRTELFTKAKPGRR